MTPLIDQDSFFWELVEPYFTPFLLCIVAIVAFAYFTSVGKKRLGMYVSSAIVFIAVIWLVVNLIT